MTPSPDNRRTNLELRELLDEMLALVRGLANRAPTMTPDELDYAQRRLEWYVDEVWRAATGGERER